MRIKINRHFRGADRHIGEFGHIAGVTAQFAIRLDRLYLEVCRRALVFVLGPGRNGRKVRVGSLENRDADWLGREVARGHDVGAAHIGNRKHVDQREQLDIIAFLRSLARNIGAALAVDSGVHEEVE